MTTLALATCLGCQGRLASGAGDVGSPSADNPDAGAPTTALWAFQGHTTGQGDVGSVVANEAGLVAVTGSYDPGHADFGMGPTPDVGSFFTMLDASGKVQWTQFTSATASFGRVTFDPDGNVLTAGELQTTASFGGTTLIAPANTYAGFLSRWDRAGHLLWAKVITMATPVRDVYLAAELSSVAVAQDGTIYVAGGFDASEVDLGGGPFPTGASAANSWTWNAFIAAYSHTGGFLWAHIIPSTGDVSANRIVALPTGPVVSGTFKETVDLGSGVQHAKANIDTYLLALDPSGRPLWSHTFAGVSFYINWTALARDRAGVVFAGGFQGPVDFGTGVLSSTTLTDPDVAVARYGPDGTATWTARVGRVGYDDVSDVSVDPEGDVFVVGRSAADAHTELEDFVAAKLSPTGAILWTWYVPDGPPHLGAMGRAVSWGGGGLFVGGDFDQGVVLAPDISLRTVSGDFFVARITP